MRLLLEIAVAHLRGRARQSLVSVAGVALGVGFAVAMAALMQGSQREFLDTLVDSIPHVQITDERRAAPRQPAQDRFDAVQFRGLRPRDDLRGVLNPTAVEAGLRAWAPGALSAGLRLSGVASYGGAERGVTIFGVEPAQEALVSSVAGDMTVGRLTDLSGQPNGVAIGESLAARLNARPGDQITLTAGAGDPRALKVVALFRTGVVSLDEGQAFINLKTAQALARRPSAINDIRLRLPDPSQAPAIAARAEALLGYKAVSWQEANRQIFESFQIRNVIMYTVVGAILVVAGFGVFNIVSIITHEKARDIAILKSLGFSAADMRRLFLFEGLFMGALGSGLGAGLGLGLTRLLETVEFQVPNAVGMSHLPVVYAPSHYLIASAVAVAAAGIAGYLPARKAARLNPVDIIRGAA
jgi:lipoprotein-releasing system permease protein